MKKLTQKNEREWKREKLRWIKKLKVDSYELRDKAVGMGRRHRNGFGILDLFLGVPLGHGPKFLN